jgi:glc operon protein GlcG
MLVCTSNFRIARIFRLKRLYEARRRPYRKKQMMSQGNHDMNVGLRTRQWIAPALMLILGVLSRPASAQLAEKKVLTLAAAQKMVAAAQLEAERKHLAGVIAVVDDGGWPILMLRMDHAAFVASVELAPGKARTAALFKKPSQALEDAINHGRTAAVTAHDFIEMQGGLPVVVDGEVIGGIGASFDTPEHDVEIARAGLAALTP